MHQMPELGHKSWTFVELLSLHLDSILGDETLLDIRYSDDANSACQ